METKKKINTLGLLRGLAVVAVCFCHFGYAMSLGKVTDMTVVYRAMGDYGKFRINVFFVVSGFIIPLSMNRAKYELRFFFKFLLKRAARLYPPYLIGLLLTLIIVILANRVKHIPFPENLSSIIKSCFFLYAPGDNPVFWTLKIEAEYYFFIAFYFVLLKINQKLTLCISLPIFMYLSQSDFVQNIELLNFLVFFLIGIVGYLIYDLAESNWLEFLCMGSLIIFSFIFYEFPSAMAATLTIAVILFYKGKTNKYFDFLGEISYSIYLIHYPIGIKLINVTIKYIDPKYYFLLFIATNLIVFAIAFVFWKYLEKPFANLSNKIKYGISKVDPKPLPSTV